MFVTESSLIKSFNRLCSTKTKLGFWGLLFILKAAKKKAGDRSLTKNSLLSFDGGEVSEGLETLFSFSANTHSPKNKKLVVSDNYIQDTFEKFLSKEKIALTDSICLLMHHFDFKDSTPELLKEQFASEYLLGEDELNYWFIDDLPGDLEFDTTRISDYKKLFNLPGDKKSIHVTKDKYMTAEAGEWGRSGYLQPFSNTSSSKEFAQVIEDDLIPSIFNTKTKPPVHLTPRPMNKIFFGVPGVGKSYAVNKLVSGKKFIRTVFHPSITSSDFIGTMMPSISDEHGKREATYDYQPGAFLRALKLAEDCRVDNSHAYLVIEELNRAPAESVFADAFQLLDRDMNGVSEFPVSLDINALNYLKQFAPNSLSGDDVIIPNNLSILATMNYSDQNVFNLDNAFKRRWELEFIPIDFDNCPNFKFQVTNSDKNKTEVSWKAFAQTINKTFEENGYADDQKIGQYFISEHEFKIFGEKIIFDKLFSYIWEEVLDSSSRDLIFEPSILSFQKLHILANSQGLIFSETFLMQLLSSEG